MSISVQSNLNPYSLFTREIGDKYIQQAVNSSSKEDATHLDIFTKIKDWFCGTKTDEVLGLLYDLTHTPDNQSDIESSLQKAEAFYKLKEMSPAKHQDKFQASIIKNEASSDYTFKFSIKGAMEERAFSYGDINVKDNRDFFGEKNYKTHFNERLGNFCNKGNPDNTWIYDFIDSHQEIKKSMYKLAEKPSPTSSLEAPSVNVAVQKRVKKDYPFISSISLNPQNTILSNIVPSNQQYAKEVLKHSSQDESKKQLSASDFIKTYKENLKPRFDTLVNHDESKKRADDGDIWTGQNINGFIDDELDLDENPYLRLQDDPLQPHVSIFETKMKY